MIIIKANNVTVNGVLSAEDIIIKTVALDKYANQKTLAIQSIVYPKTLYLKLQKLPEEQRMFSVPQPFIINGLGVIEINWDNTIVTGWQAQNELVKQKLVELGISETYIIICEDIDENGNPINIVQ